MPNWAWTDIKVKGSKENIKGFLKLFLTYETNNKEEERLIKEILGYVPMENDILISKERFFPRTYIEDNMETIKEALKEGNDDEMELTLNCSCAWSASACMIEDTYLAKDKRCVTLENMCEEFDLDVWIDCVEEGNGFIQYIQYIKDEKLLVFKEEAMVSKVCPKCKKEFNAHPYSITPETPNPLCPECRDIEEGNSDEK